MGYKVLFYRFTFHLGVGRLKAVTRRDIYTQLEWTVPQPGCGPLAVFASLDDAVQWRRQFRLPDSQCRIYECYYTPSTAGVVMQWDWFGHITEAAMPKGKVLCDAVYLTKEALAPSTLRGR